MVKSRIIPTRFVECLLQQNEYRTIKQCSAMSDLWSVKSPLYPIQIIFCPKHWYRHGVTFCGQLLFSCFRLKRLWASFFMKKIMYIFLLFRKSIDFWIANFLSVGYENERVKKSPMYLLLGYSSSWFINTVTYCWWRFKWNRKIQAFVETGSEIVSWNHIEC